MAVTDWFVNLFKNRTIVNIDGMYGELVGELFYKELAVQTSINLIANTVARSEFLTYEKGKEVRKSNYYLFNVEPNQNKSASKFWREVIQKLVYENECLVVQINDMLYIADSFTKVKFALKENIYKDIVIDEYELKDVFTESKVLHFELHDQKISTIIDGIYADYSKLVKASSMNYKKNNARRGTLEVPTNYPQTEKAQEDLENLLKNRFKRFFEAEGGSVLPLTNGLKYTELLSNIGAKSSSVEGRDIRGFIDDIFDYVAIAFQIPPSLLKGNTVDTKDAVNNFLTFCINPIAELLTDEINRKLYGKTLYLEKTYLKLDTTRIKAVDIKDIANALDILFRVGANTINDNLRILGREEIEDPIANERFVTKNYHTVKEALKGGE